MPEVQEVFRMATQKVRQDPGALDRQVTKQRKAARNRRVGAYATVLLLVAAVVGFYALTRGSTTQTPANTSPIATIGEGAGPSTMVDLDSGTVTPLPASLAGAGSSFAMSPDQTTIAFSACCNSGSPLYLANVDGTNVHPVSQPGKDAIGAQWSPDGSMLVYQQHDATTRHLGDLYLVDPAHGNVRTQLTHLDQTLNYGWWLLFPSFSPDGRSVLFHMPRRDQATALHWALWSVPVAGGEPTLVRRDAGWGGYSPDGASLAYLSPIDPNFSGETLWVEDVHGGTPTRMIDGHLTWPRWSPDGSRISYNDNGSIYVLDFANGTTTRIAQGDTAEWANAHTLIIGPGGSG